MAHAAHSNDLVFTVVIYTVYLKLLQQTKQTNPKSNVCRTDTRQYDEPSRDQVLHATPTARSTDCTVQYTYSYVYTVRKYSTEYCTPSK